jgi:hypothetical protein
LSEFFGVLHIVSSSVDGEDLHVFLSTDPLLMPVMHLLEVGKRNALLTLPVALLNALKADEGVALEVDDGRQGTVHHQGITDVTVDAELRDVHVGLTPHYFSEDVAVSHGRSLGEMTFGGFFLESTVPKLSSGVKGVELEGEGPPLGISVVALQDIAAGSVGPLIDWFFDDTHVHVGEKSALARPEVALD